MVTPITEVQNSNFLKSFSHSYLSFKFTDPCETSFIANHCSTAVVSAKVESSWAILPSFGSITTRQHYSAARTDSAAHGSGLSKSSSGCQEKLAGKTKPAGEQSFGPAVLVAQKSTVTATQHY